MVLISPFFDSTPGSVYPSLGVRLHRREGILVVAESNVYLRRMSIYVLEVKSYEISPSHPHPHPSHISRIKIKKRIS